MAVMTAKKLAEKCIDVANNYKTLYVMGCFGAPLNGMNVSRYCSNHSYNKRSDRKSIIKSKANKNYFGFDCVNLIKGILWGWNGNYDKTYGGASYAVNGVPDINADQMIEKCSEVSTNFSKIEVGEVVWLQGHIGVYIGNGLAVECTPRWANDVQITAVGNIGSKKGYNTRYWTKHGKLPYVSYEKVTEKNTATEKKETETKKTTTKKKYTGAFPDVTPNLKKGSKGVEVGKLQKFLNWYGKYGLAVDNDFGSKTEAAVKKYQKAEDLVVDGIFGSKSLAQAKKIKK